MDFIETRLKGAFLIRPQKIEDQRGYFARAWCCDEFASHGLVSAMSQLNIGFNHRKGALRGLHYQEKPHAEAKLVRCTRGAVFDVLVDLRPESATSGQWVAAELTADNADMLYAPEGFAHGYQALADGAEIYYLTSAPYAASAVRGVRYNDPALGIQWPLPVEVISEADQKWPDLRRNVSQKN
jgi:dTDP-4-dehydrorhamnose 3,5-epimerase